MKPQTVHVDTTSPTPPYEQVRAQLADLIMGGYLRVDARLPSVRQLATDLGLAPGTVARAYRELESEGLIRSRRGAGTRVTPPQDRVRHEEELLAEAARAYITAGRSLGADDELLHVALRAALRAEEADLPAPSDGARDPDGRKTPPG